MTRIVIFAGQCCALGGIRNPAYSSTFVFEERFAALKPDTQHARLDVENSGLLVAEA